MTPEAPVGPDLVLLGDHGRFVRPDDRVGNGPHTPIERPPAGPERAAVAALAWAAFGRAVERALVRGGRPVLERDDDPPAGVVARPGRRDLVAMAMGLTPVLYHPSTVTRAMPAEGVHLYLDVSGSTVGWVAAWTALARRLGDRLVQPVWAWSGEVHPVTMASLLRGAIPSDGDRVRLAN